MLGSNYILTKNRGLVDINDVKSSDIILVSDGDNIFFGRPIITDVDVYVFNPVDRDMFWHGSEDNIKIDGYYSRRIIDDVVINASDFVRFFGIWVMDGSVTKKNGVPRRVVLTPRIEIDDILSALPFKYKRYNNRYEINNTQLAKYLYNFGNKKYRLMPQEIKDLSSRLLQELVRMLYYGTGDDGRFFTSSLWLASDIVEVFAKLNRNIYISQWSSGMYVVSESSKDVDAYIDMLYWKPSQDYVYMVMDGYGRWFKVESRQQFY